MSSERHNAASRCILRDMVEATGGDVASLNALAESLLLGVGLVNFRDDPRKAAQMIQEIANGAIDRCTTLPAPEPGGPDHG